MSKELHDVARHIHKTTCNESVSLLYTPLQQANHPYQEPIIVPTEVEQIFIGGVNPRKNKTLVGPGGLQIPADYTVLAYIPDFEKRTGITIVPERLDWLLQCRLLVRGALCSVTHYHITGHGAIWLTIFAAREQV